MGLPPVHTAQESDPTCWIPPNLGFLGLKEVEDVVVAVDGPASGAGTGGSVLILVSVSPLGVPEALEDPVSVIGRSLVLVYSVVDRSERKPGLEALGVSRCLQ